MAQHSNHADIIVIGGGIAGISAAAELARDAHVLVLERESRIGYHSTGRSAAIYIRNYGNATLRAINAVAEPGLVTPEGVSDFSLLSPRGELMVATEAEMDTFQSYIEGSVGVDCLTSAEAVDLVPILRPEPIAAALYERDAQGIDVDRMLQGYARLLKTRGGRIQPDAPVTQLRHDGVWHITAGGQDYSAPIVVNATGAWADHVADLACVARIGLQPMRRSAAIIPSPEGHDIRNWPLFGSISETWYAKPDAQQLMVSPADQDPVEPMDAWPDDMVLAEGLHRFSEAVTVPVTRVTHSWAGLRTFAPDRTPVVGFTPQSNGFFWLAGQGGYGVQTAPALARLCAALITAQDAPLSSDVIHALSPIRFA
ncbi:FAD-dependent oxidoreductase [Roseovarius aestuarii]|nr:FAD-dependent oxidoreductase [Roseovarius aestuarii]